MPTNEGLDLRVLVIHRERGRTVDLEEPWIHARVHKVVQAKQLEGTTRQHVERLGLAFDVRQRGAEYRCCVAGYSAPESPESFSAWREISKGLILVIKWDNLEMRFKEKVVSGTSHGHCIDNIHLR